MTMAELEGVPQHISRPTRPAALEHVLPTRDPDRKADGTCTEDKRFP